MCRPHLSGKRRRDARIAADNARYDAERAREKFVREWRQQNPDLVSGSSWECPLCRRILQAGESEEHYETFLASMIGKHQRFHGEDWTAYEALGAVAPGAGGE